MDIITSIDTVMFEDEPSYDITFETPSSQDFSITFRNIKTQPIQSHLIDAGSFTYMIVLTPDLPVDNVIECATLSLVFIKKIQEVELHTDITIHHEDQEHDLQQSTLQYIFKW